MAPHANPQAVRAVTAFAYPATVEYDTLGLAWEVDALLANTIVENTGDHDAAPSRQEQAGFAWGVMAAFLVGLAYAAACIGTAGVGCVLVAVAIGSLMGSVVSAVTYAYVTTALGGTPTAEGLSHAYIWGAIAGAAGASFGARATAGVRNAGAEAADAQEAADEIITVRHYTSAEGRAGITKTGRINPSRDGYVYVVEPSEMEGYVGQRAIQQRLGLATPDRAVTYYEFQVPRGALVPLGKTSGGARQYGILGEVLLKEFPGVWWP